VRIGERIIMEGVVVGPRWDNPGLLPDEREAIPPDELVVRVTSARTDTEATSVRPGLADGYDVTVRLSEPRASVDRVADHPGAPVNL
jgi:hypothetical protein